MPYTPAPPTLSEEEVQGWLRVLGFIGFVRFRVLRYIGFKMLFIGFVGLNLRVRVSHDEISDRKKRVLGV